LDEQSKQPDNEDVEEAPAIPPQETTARFYFTLTFNLAGEDITKIAQIEKMNVYLVLNTAAILKDKRIKEQNELRKLEQQQKNR
jgi:hypothetical protein